MLVGWEIPKCSVFGSELKNKDTAVMPQDTNDNSVQKEDEQVPTDLRLKTKVFTSTNQVPRL